MAKFKDSGDSLLVQQHQQIDLVKKTDEVSKGIDHLEDLKQENINLFDDLDAQLDMLLDSVEDVPSLGECTTGMEIERLLDVSEKDISDKILCISPLDTLHVSEEMNWNEYLESVNGYAVQHCIDLSTDPFEKLMTDSQRIQLEKRIAEEFSYKNASCDKYDYMLAATCGLIGGLVDVFLVGMPGEGMLGKASDQAVDKAVEGFASACGWKGPREGSDSTKSAIGFLERSYQVNYDQQTGSKVGNLFDMTTTNHHMKSLGHSPDLVGLFFSILGQFIDKSYFVDSGKIISVDTKSFELKGSNFAGKVYAGFVNWLGHLFSDMAGSSGASSRGSGIPIPFYSLFQFLNVGEFGQDKQTFATVAVKVFEQGYDLRHGLAMAVPVLITELLVRFSWTFKRKYYHNKRWGECIPSAVDPELRRMLLVGHGSLCLVDGLDAGIRSGGDIVQFLLRANMLAWARFSFLALKEVKSMYMVGKMDVDAVNEYLDSEYEKMLRYCV